MLEIILNGTDEEYSLPKKSKLVIDTDVTANNLKTYGTIEESFVAIEELGELTQAISKVNRQYTYKSNDSIWDNLYEEMADAYIVLTTMIQAFDLDVDWLQTMIERKQRRSITRVGEINGR